MWYLEVATKVMNIEYPKENKRRHFISRVDILLIPNELNVIRTRRPLWRPFNLTSCTYVPVMEMPASGKITFGNKALYTSFWKLKACWSIKTPPLIRKRVSNVVNVNKSFMKSPLLVIDANVIKDIKFPVISRIHTFLGGYQMWLYVRILSKVPYF